MGIHHDDHALELFTKNFSALRFHLSPNKEADEEHISFSGQGKVRFQAGFKKPVPEPVT